MKKQLFISLATLSLMFGSLIGCNKQGGESKQSSLVPSTTSETSKPSSEDKSSIPSSSAEPVHVHSYAQSGEAEKNIDDKEVKLYECSKKDSRYIAIAFDDYSEKSADFGSTSSYNNVPETLRNESRLLAKNSTITWKFNLDKAASKAEIAFGVIYTGSDHGDQTGSDGGTVKYSVQTNGGEFVDWTLGSTTYDQAGLSQTERAYLTFVTADLVAGENIITLRQNNAGYRLLFGGEVRVIYTEDAKPVTPFGGYKVTFVAEHCKVLVYKTKAYTTEEPVETTSSIARDETGAIVAYDPADEELQPQVSFKVVCDEGYSCTATNITVTGTFKNLKQNPDNQEGQDNIFRVTKVQTDLTINIAPVAGEQAPGYAITFVTQNCFVIVYIGPKNEAGTNVDSSDVIYGRAKEAPYDITYTNPQLNFEVVCDEGYEFVPVIASNKVTFIDGEYNKFSSEAGYYNITKIASDLTITITATLISD